MLLYSVEMHVPRPEVVLENPAPRSDGSIFADDLDGSLDRAVDHLGAAHAKFRIGESALKIDDDDPRPLAPADLLVAIAALVIVHLY